MNISNSARAGLAFGAGGVVLLSPDALMLRLFHGDDFSLVAGRGVVWAALTAVFVVVAPVLRRDFFWRPAMLYGALYAAGLASFPLAVRHTHVANVLVIVAAAPLFAAIGARIFLLEHIPRRTWIASAVTAAGLFGVFAPQLSRGGGFGDFLALITALSLAACAIFIRKHPKVNVAPGMAFGGLMVAALYAPFAGWNLAARDVGLLTANGAVVLCSFWLIVAASRRLSPPEVNLLFLLETALAPLWVWLALGEEPPAATIAAGVLIGAVLIWHSAAALRGTRRE